MLKPEIKVEGKSVKIKIDGEYKIDKDQDGKASVYAKSSNEIQIDGLELVDELLKDSEVLNKILEKAEAIKKKIGLS